MVPIGASRALSVNSIQSIIPNFRVIRMPRGATEIDKNSGAYDYCCGFSVAVLVKF